MHCRATGWCCARRAKTRARGFDSRGRARPPQKRGSNPSGKASAPRTSNVVPRREVNEIEAAWAPGIPRCSSRHICRAIGRSSLRSAPRIVCAQTINAEAAISFPWDRNFSTALTRWIAKSWRLTRRSHGLKTSLPSASMPWRTWFATTTNSAISSFVISARIASIDCNSLLWRLPAQLSMNRNRKFTAALAASSLSDERESS